jgi:hypothetical protein
MCFASIAVHPAFNSIISIETIAIHTHTRKGLLRVLGFLPIRGPPTSATPQEQVFIFPPIPYAATTTNMKLVASNVISRLLLPLLFHVNFSLTMNHCTCIPLNSIFEDNGQSTPTHYAFWLPTAVPLPG